MQEDPFRKWFLKELGLPVDSVVYPASGRHDQRPDLKVLRDGSTEAWIEVELSRSEEQVQRYRKHFDEHVKTVWGRKSDGGDLSLEEIADHLASRTYFPPQTRVNAQHLQGLIQDGLSKHSPSQRRADVSDEMWNHPLVAELRERLGGRLVRTTGSLAQGFVGVDTTDTRNNQGVSLRVKSERSSSKTLSIMNITAGRSEVGFPSLAKLRRYLPDHDAEVSEYASLLADMGLQISGFEERQRPSLPLDAVTGRLDDLAACARVLAGPPRGVDAFGYKQREIAGWIVPTVSLVPAVRDPLRLRVSGTIVNSVPNGDAGLERLKDWKRHLTREVKHERGGGPWDSGHEYAISLALRFYPDNHGNRRLDADNFIKPILDGIAAGIFCDSGTDPSTIGRWNFDDSNFNTLLVRRLPDADNSEDEGVAIFVAAREFSREG